jgi:hypothetical protein
MRHAVANGATSSSCTIGVKRGAQWPHSMVAVAQRRAERVALLPALLTAAQYPARLGREPTDDEVFEHLGVLRFRR